MDFAKNPVQIRFADASIDCETLGIGPRSVVWSVGVTWFDAVSGVIHETREYLFPVLPQLAAGSNLDPSTYEFWSKQAAKDPSSFYPIMEGNLEMAVRRFHLDVCDHYFKGQRAWAKSPTFDLERMVEPLFEMFGLKAPWSPFEHRDVRTIQEFTSLKPTVPHRAGEDSRIEAAQVIDAFKNASQLKQDAKRLEESLDSAVEECRQLRLKLRASQDEARGLRKLVDEVKKPAAAPAQAPAKRRR